MPEYDEDNRRLRLLAAMGIDVWRRRVAGSTAIAPAPTAAASAPVAASAPIEAPQSAARRQRSAVVERAPAAPSAPAARTSERRAPTEVLPAPSRPAAARTDRIEFVALSGPAAVVVGALSTAEARRIAHGIYLALAGPGAEPATARFEWPPAGAVVAGAAAAESACKAFLAGQVDRARAACLVLLGDAVTDRLPDPDRITVPVIRAPTAAALRAEPRLKRELWRAIAATLMH